jgi:predicted unusual protein kinase regulating ubiquinone biosynthesis (AarF/ABC1/UbiB family)
MFWKKTEETPVKAVVRDDNRSPTSCAGDDGGKAPHNKILCSSSSSSLLLRQRLRRLQDRCDRLEAQNIIVPVQQLDLLAQGLAVVAAAASLWVWWRTIDVIIYLLRLPSTIRVWKMIATVASRYPSLEVAIRTCATSRLGTYVAPYLSKIALLVPAEIVPTLLPASLYSAIIPWWRWMIKLLLFGAPIVYDQAIRGGGVGGGGLYYRRCQVFAVFFIILARTWLCRWRERMFATDSVDYHGSLPNNRVTEPFAATQPQLDDNEGDDEEDITSTDHDPTTTSKTTQAADTITHDAIWDAYYEISARFLYVSVLRLRGLWTKSAQYLASRADFVPTPYITELSKLQDSAPVTPWEIIARQIPANIRTQITHLQEEPLASASIGQVHRAVWRTTGAPIVVKVQHPHARSLLFDDFWSLLVFCRIVRWLEPNYGFLEILMREWADEARHELDFVQEARNLRDANKGLQTLLLGPSRPLVAHGRPFHVEIPTPILATRNVLIMNFCDGVRVDNIRQIQDVWNIPTTAVMNAVAQTFAHLMYSAPLFNGDPHPGNIFIRPNNNNGSYDDDSSNNQAAGGFTVVLLDWGLAKRLPEAKRKAFCQMAVAAATFDFGLLLDAFATIGLQLKRENVAEDMEGIRFLLRNIMPGHDSRKRIKAKINTDMVRQKMLIHRFLVGPL